MYGKLTVKDQPGLKHTTAAACIIEDLRQHLLAPAAQTDLSYELSQSGVAQQQPASGSDAVGFVLKLLRF